MVTRLELFSDRKNLQAFIDSDPAVIRLKRRPKIKSAAGGFTLGTEVILPLQTFRLTPFKRRLSHGTSGGAGAGEGRVASLPYVLIGPWNADIQRDDYFDYKGLRYEVVSLAPDRDVRTAAELIEKGATGG